MAEEVLTAGPGQPIELGAASQLGCAPFRVEQPALFETIKRGIERAFFELDGRAGGVLNPLADGVAMHGAARQGLEDQRVERAVEEICWIPRHSKYQTGRRGKGLVPESRTLLV